MPDRRINDTIMAVGAGVGGNDIASRITFGRFGIERGMLGQGTQVDKYPRHAGEHLAIFDDCIEVACMGKRFGQMMPDLDDAGFGGKRSIPCASVLGIEAHRLARLGVSETGVYEFRMWNAVDKFVLAQAPSSSGFGDQSPARRALYFGKQIAFCCGIGKRLKDSGPKPGAGDKTDGAREGLANQRQRRFRARHAARLHIAGFRA